MHAPRGPFCLRMCARQYRCRCSCSGEPKQERIRESRRGFWKNLVLCVADGRVLTAIGYRGFWLKRRGRREFWDSDENQDQLEVTRNQWGDPTNPEQGFFGTGLYFDPQQDPCAASLRSGWFSRPLPSGGHFLLVQCRKQFLSQFYHLLRVCLVYHRLADFVPASFLLSHDAPPSQGVPVTLGEAILVPNH